jgi:lipopolysaccharide transport system ATP-binding protein
MTNAIKIEGLGKSYVIRHEQGVRYLTLRDLFTDAAKALGRRARNPFASRETQSIKEVFWALRDINLEIKEGERIGIIGRNGAGKSTMLKLLSRITEPTEGRIEIRGRVSSLLEVGTGFHPELTGRENIFLNGTILGMPSQQIRRKFDEIVAFAEIERFLDTPVKRYSSGMYVRLAFSVAAHLEPDILIVDEVLAVGDVQFQRKCLGKMEEVTGQGRTVILVSHNMTTVTSLCTRCVLVEQGRLQTIGDVAQVTAAYYQGGFSGRGAEFVPTEKTQGYRDDVAILKRARLIDADHQPIEFARIDQQIGIEMYFEVLQSGHQLVPNIHVFTQGQYAFVSYPSHSTHLPKGTYVLVMWIPANFLNDGVYVAGIALSTMSPVKAHFYVSDAIMFSVIDDLTDPARHEYVQAIPGIIRPRLEWTTETRQAREAAP